MRTAHCVGLLLLAASTLAMAQVPVSQEPRHRVRFENAELRILDVNVPPGDTTLDHLHDRDIVTVSMTSGTDTRAQVTGQPWTTRPPRPLGHATVTEYAGRPGSHRVENVGRGAYQLLAVENLRTGGWSETPAISGLATKMTAESRSFRVYDVSLASEHFQTSHTHATPTIVLLLTGKVMSDGPDAKAKANAPAPVGLKQLDQPGQWVLVPGGDTHHLVRLGTSEARVVEIEVR